MFGLQTTNPALLLVKNFDECSPEIEFYVDFKKINGIFCLYLEEIL
jgi:hypothetical protein